MILKVVPEGLIAASAEVEALTARLAAVQAAAAPVIGAVVPPAVDPVSLQAAAGFSARGSSHAAVAAEAAEELGRSGLGIAETAESYTVGDLRGAAGFGAELG